jgi:3-isopropylmalate dehydrogenase
VEYTLRKGRLDGGETAFDTCTYTELKCNVYKSFELAMTRKKNYVVLIANVLENSFMERNSTSYGKTIPVEVSYEFVDAVGCD